MSEATKEQMALPKHGEIIWTEVATNNLDECRKFYSEIFGWKINKSANEAVGMEYYEADTGKGYPLAGMYEMKDEYFGGEAPPPHIMNYIAVDDVDASAAKTKELGGAVLSEPADIPGTGRMCFVQDPTGAAFSLIKLNYDQTGSESLSDQNIHEHGDICWFEITTKDTTKAKDFYSQLLGWEYKQNELVDMDYPEFQVNGKSLGGMMQMTEEWGDMPSHWMTYIAVDDVDATCEKVEEMGGKVCVPPTDIAVGRFSVINDPSGATLSVIKLNSE